MWAEKPSKRRCGAVVSNVLTLDGSKLLPVCICFVNFYDMVDGSMLRCTGSGIGCVSLFVSNMLTLDGSELFPVCICFFWVSGEYSRSKGEVRKVMLLFSIAQYA